MTDDHANVSRSKMLDFGKGPVVLLFYDGFEWQLRRGTVGRGYAQGRRVARFLYRNLRRTQVHTGFYTAFLALRRSLEVAGCDVRVNRFDIAEKHPDYPIGVAGYPSVLAKIPPRNPVIFGPGDFGMPNNCEEVARNPRFRILIQPSEWFCDVYRPACGAKIRAWFAGIDTNLWRDASGQRKEIDCLIYDKIRWNREIEVSEVFGRLQAHLRSRGLSSVVLRYGRHARTDFAREAARSRSMIFLCEHETQGLAYQEAMAMNVPIFAWDEGRLVDPWLAPFTSPGLKVSSVPYFSDECGRTFQKSRLEPSFEEFWTHLTSYRPRDYVLRELSMEKSAAAYLNVYKTLLPSEAP